MDKLFDKDLVAKAIYGLISMLAVLLTMEEHPPTAWIAAGILFGTVFVLALAETYSATIVEIIAGQKRLDRQVCDPPYPFAFGLHVGHLLHASRWRILFSGLFTAGIGALIGLMKFLLH